MVVAVRHPSAECTVIFTVCCLTPSTSLCNDNTQNLHRSTKERIPMEFHNVLAKKFLCISCLLVLPNLYGQHNFGFGSLSRFHGRGDEACLISISPPTKVFPNLIGWKGWNVRIKMRQFPIHILNGTVLVVITKKGRCISISWPCKLRWSRWTQIQSLRSSGGLTGRRRPWWR